LRNFDFNQHFHLPFRFSLIRGNPSPGLEKQARNAPGFYLLVKKSIQTTLKTAAFATPA
jgi:hypothetical protein